MIVLKMKIIAVALLTAFLCSCGYKAPSGKPPEPTEAPKTTIDILEDLQGNYYKSDDSRAYKLCSDGIVEYLDFGNGSISAIGYKYTGHINDSGYAKCESDSLVYVEYVSDEEIKVRFSAEVHDAKLLSHDESLYYQLPSVGMSEEDVPKTSWGEPSKKNVTETAAGKREQWVYGSGRYVYIENGVVSSIQY